MLTVEPGMAARSLAGHDKGQWYLILRVEGREVYLIDGRTRTKERPKKKLNLSKKNFVPKMI